MNNILNYTAAYPAGLSCQIGYTRDAIGRIAGKTEDINGITTTWGYTYDQAGRLTQTTKNGDLWASYGYDTNGNRLTKTTSSQTITGTYDAQDRLLAYGNYVFTYTANGELETKTDTATSETTTYSYDVLGNLKSVVLPDTTVIEYVVDGRNRRVGKKVNGTLERQWIYDGQLRPVAELDGAGALVSQFVYATHINVPDYIVKETTTYRVITDHLGSLRFVIDTASGTIAQRMDYDDWGNVLVNTAPDFTPFGFAGGLYDSQTKLVRFGARDYDAEVGKWTSKDPISFEAGDGNLYSYLGNEPLNDVDPLGEGSECCKQDYASCLSKCIERERVDWLKTLGTLTGTLGFGTLPKSAEAGEMKGLSKRNPWTSQLSRWKMRLGLPHWVRDLGRTTAMEGVGAALTGLTVFEGFYDIGAIGRCAVVCCQDKCSY